MQYSFQLRHIVAVEVDDCHQFSKEEQIGLEIEPEVVPFQARCKGGCISTFLTCAHLNLDPESRSLVSSLGGRFTGVELSFGSGDFGVLPVLANGDNFRGWKGEL